MRKSFTVLELMVTIIIIGILATIISLQLFKGLERVRTSEGRNVLATLRSSQLRYYAEHARFTSNLADLDTDVALGLKYFSTPTLFNPSYDENNPAVIASITRNNFQNHGYGAYTLQIDSNGGVSCIPGPPPAAKGCPPGF